MKIFPKLMLQWKVSAAVKLLEESSQNDILPSSPEVIDLLKKKQPPAEPIQHVTLIQGTMHTKGSCSPSHVNSEQFRHIIYSGHLKAEGKVLESLVDGHFED